MSFLYRDHRGGLAESLITVKVLEDRTELEDYLVEQMVNFGLGLNPKSIVIEPYAKDDRIGWDTHIVRGRLYGKSADPLMVLGFTNGPVPSTACRDCGTTENVCMYNTREVRGGFLWLGTRTKTFPGRLCIECWKLANPKTFAVV